MRPAKRLALPWLLFKKHAVWSACSNAPCALERVLLAGPWLDRNCARVRDATGALETRVGCTLGADGRIRMVNELAMFQHLASFQLHHS